MAIKNAIILYLGMTTNIKDRSDALTLGTSEESNLDCREWAKQFDSFKIIYCSDYDDSKSKGQWEYYEKNHLSPHLSQILCETRVEHDRKSFVEKGRVDENGNPRCNGRTDNWWSLGNTPTDLVIKHIIEKLERDYY